MIRTTIPILTLLLPVACSDDDSNLSSPNTVGAPSGDPTGVTTADSSGDDPEDMTTGGTTGAAPEPTGGAEPSPDVPVCNPADDLEPNNIEDEATVLNNITDEDGAGSLVESILAGDQDVDWFAYTGKDVAFAYVDPAGTLETDMELQLCLFVECAIGFTPVPDCIDSIYDESPDGRGGCCNTGESAFVSIDLTCVDGGGDDSAYVFMRVDRGYANVCVPYDLEYHF